MKAGRLTGALPVAALLIFWQAGSWLLATPLLPGPIEIGRNIFTAGELGRNLIASFFRLAGGLSISFLLGIPLGLAAGRIGPLDKVMGPLAFFLHPIPKTLFIPPLLLLLGVGEASKILLLVLSVFFAVFFSVRDAAKGIDGNYILSIRSMGGKFSDTLLLVFFPAVLPAVFSSLRVSLGIAAAVLFFAEYFGTSLGMGWFIMDAMARMDYPDLYSGIIVFSLLLWLLYLLLDRTEKLLCPWISLPSG